MSVFSSQRKNNQYQSVHLSFNITLLLFHLFMSELVKYCSGISIVVSSAKVIFVAGKIYVNSNNENNQNFNFLISR